MDRADFQYALPPELIAQVPLAERRASRLLVLDGKSGALADRQFVDIVHWLAPGDLLVVTSGTHDINCTMLRNDVCETEEVTLVAVSGSTITIAAPLRYTHPVQSLTADGRTVTLALIVDTLLRPVSSGGSRFLLPTQGLPSPPITISASISS